MSINSDSEVEKKEKKRKKLSFTIPQQSSLRPYTKGKINIYIKREPKRTTNEYLAILKQLDILLNSQAITDAQRRDYCKSQRYFMKLYLKKMRESGQD
jgi:hypothetical protein